MRTQSTTPSRPVLIRHPLLEVDFSAQMRGESSDQPDYSPIGFDSAWHPRTRVPASYPPCFTKGVNHDSWK